MSIPTVTEATFRAPAPTAPSAAPVGIGAAAVQQEAAAKAIAPVPAPEAPAAPPPPEVGFQQDVLVGIDEATNRKVYDIVEPESGDQIVQIPAEAVLNLIASILQRLEAEGLR